MAPFLKGFSLSSLYSLIKAAPEHPDLISGVLGRGIWPEGTVDAECVQQTGVQKWMSEAGNTWGNSLDTAAVAQAQACAGCEL